MECKHTGLLNWGLHYTLQYKLYQPISLLFDRVASSGSKRVLFTPSYHISFESGLTCLCRVLLKRLLTSIKVFLFLYVLHIVHHCIVTCTEIQTQEKSQSHWGWKNYLCGWFYHRGTWFRSHFSKVLKPGPNIKHMSRSIIVQHMLKYLAEWGPKNREGHAKISSLNTFTVNITWYFSPEFCLIHGSTTLCSWQHNYGFLRETLNWDIMLLRSRLN